MEPERLAFVIPVADMEDAVARWSRLLRTAATVVDSDRWAQFDWQGTRLCLAGTDRCVDVPALMVKVRDLAAALAEAGETGARILETQRGPHEIRAAASWDDGATVIFYQPLSGA